MANPPPTLLDPLAIGRAESLGMMARFIVEGYMAGEHKSPFRGFAIEFTQHREYVPGDDVRRIDFKVLGRTDRYYVKQYEQETNFVAHILLDASQSMQYGSGKISKLQYGKVMAACLSYVILNQHDAVAVGVFDQTLKAFVPRTGNLSSVHNIMQVLAGFQPVGQTNIGGVLDELAGQIKRKGIVIVISDLFDDEEQVLRGIQHLRFGGSEVIIFHTLDPHEVDFPFTGLVEFEGLEMPDKLRTRPREIRKSYLRALGDFQTRLRDGCERNNVHYVPVNTGHPLHEVLSGYLAFRMRTTAR
jgi:uncharacterized protein (DUF58 family)